VFIAVLLGTLCIGGSMCVFADEHIPTSYTTEDGIVLDFTRPFTDKSLDSFKYYSVLYFDNGPEYTFYRVYLSEDTPLSVVETSDGSHAISESGSYDLYFKPDGTLKYFAQPTSTDSTDVKYFTYLTGNNDGVCSSCKQTVFQNPVIPIAQKATELPAAIAPVVERVIPVAVCCLGLLIGCLVLLPKLRMFL
jgi:hypothetical protein